MRCAILMIALGACGGGVIGNGAGGDDSPGVDAGPNRSGSNTLPDASAAGGSGSAAQPGVGPYFETPMFFNDVVTGVAPSTHSSAMIARLAAEGGWGAGAMQIDTSIDVLTADASTPMRTFTPTSDFYTPDCDDVALPVPVGGDVEGEDGYACTGDGDCHLLVADASAHTLFEMWRANITGSTFAGGCLAAWNTAATYRDTLRGDHCTSADAAGFPIAPLLFTADEVAAGHIDHAIRFILPNNRMTPGYSRPASHGTDTTGASDAPPYGAHLRLRADYPISSLPSAGARVVARAMQTYGMYQADGGNIALTAQSDKHTTAKWDGLLDVHDLAAMKVTDFEVIDHGATIPVDGDCARTTE